MHVSITKDCIICRQCECVAPNVFIVREGALIAEVLDADPPEGEHAAVIAATRGCPVHCIKLRRAATTTAEKTRK